MERHNPSMTHEFATVSSHCRKRTVAQKFAVTNARFASLHGLPVGPFSLSTPPVPLRKSRARHERLNSRIRAALPL